MVTCSPPLTEADYLHFIDYSPAPPDNIFCTEEEVYKLLIALDSTKASGPDRISAKMLKATTQSISPSLATLFSKSIALGKVPRNWKTSSVVPIPKTGNNLSDPCNCRPISLLSVVSKVLERHIHYVIFDHLMANGMLSDVQWGFTPGRSGR